MYVIGRLLMALSGLAAWSLRLCRKKRTARAPAADKSTAPNPYGLTPLQLRAKAEIDGALDAGRVADIRLPRRAGATYLAHVVHKERGGVVVSLNPAHARRFRDEHMDMFGEQPDVIADAAPLLLCGRRGPVIIDTCEPDRPGQAEAVANRQGAVRLWNEDAWDRKFVEQKRTSLDLRDAHRIVESWPTWKRELADRVLRPSRPPRSYRG